MMSLETALAHGTPEKKISQWKINPWLAPGTLIPAAVVLLMIIVAAFPKFFATHDPTAVDMMGILQAPSAEHWFGTDQLGRDTYSRLIHGTIYSLLIGLGATLIAIVFGVILGALAALAPRGLDTIVVRFIDMLLAFPELLLAMLVITVLGPGPVNTLLAVGLASVASYARLIRSQILQVRTSGYVEQAVALGERPTRIIVQHIIPNAIRPLLVLATIGVGTSILAASTLSFLGLGVAPPTPEWGSLVADSRDFLAEAFWMPFFPATAITITVIAVTLLGRRIQRILARGGA